MPTNDLTSAQSLDLTTQLQPINGSIGGNTPEKAYRFSLQNRSSLTVSLTNLSADANLELVRDNNANQLVENNEILADSYHSNSISESINTVLDSGTYYLRVIVEAPQSGAAPVTPYTLDVRAARNFAPRGNPIVNSSLINLLQTPENHLSDFDGDGKADILLTNFADQRKAIWLMNGATIKSGDYLPQVWQDGWQIEATGDFNGDRKADLLLKNESSGQKAIWLMDGATIKSGDYLPQVWQDDWQIEATGDFNGDGKSDLLLKNESLEKKAIWLMDGTTIKSGDYLPQNVWQDDWQIEATGDFNGDGKSDLLLKNESFGQKAIWLMDGTTIKSGDYLPQNVWQDDWQIEAAGDFNGDGKADLLLKNESLEKKAIWLMDGTTIKSGDYLPQSVWQDGWQIEAIADLSGDKKADIVLNNFQEDKKAIWSMDGTQVSRGDFLPDIWSEWTIDTIADLNGDGKADFMLGNTTQFQQAIWQMNGGTITDGKYLSFPSNWQASIYEQPEVLLADLAGNSANTAFRVGELINSQGTFTDNLGKTDPDWYQFTIAQTGTVSLALTLAGTLNNPVIRLYNSSQQEQTKDSSVGSDLYTLAADTYFIQLSVDEGQGDYTLSLEGTSELAPKLDLANNSPGQNTSVVLQQGSSSVLVALTATVTDNSNVLKASISLANPLDGNQETLKVDTTGTNLVATYITDDKAEVTLQLTGEASAADYQKVLQTLVYQNTATTPNSQQRTIVIDLEDNNFTSNQASAFITFWNTNEPPIIDLNGSAEGIDTNVSFVAGKGVIALAPNLLVSNTGTTLKKAEILIQNPLNGSDEVLSVDTSGTTISATYTDGLLILQGDASLVDYQKVLRTVTYSNTSLNLNYTKRTLMFDVYNEEYISDSALATITLQ